MRIAIVVQRYGERCVGGAEYHARLLAQEMHRRGHEIKVYTTTAVDYGTWANELPEGQEIVNGIPVERFPTVISRSAMIFQPLNWLVQGLWRRFHNFKIFRVLFRFVEKLWFVLQGPYTPSLVRALIKNKDKHEIFVFFTYLYYPTVVGLPKVADKAVLIPTAHDEVPFYFSSIRKLIRSCERFVVNTVAEKKLIQNTHGVKEDLITVGAMGIDFELRKDEEPEDTYLLFLGRIGPAKSVDEIICFIIRLWDHHDVKIKLYLAGKLEQGFIIPPHPAIKYFGFVDDDQKKSLITGARAIVNPSRYESLSIIVLEAILARKEVIVNTSCDVLRDYTIKLPTVYGYEDQESFDEQIKNRIIHHSVRQEDLNASAKWVRGRFTWDVVESNILSAARKLEEGSSA